jgi:hypothetical protein
MVAHHVRILLALWIVLGATPAVLAQSVVVVPDDYPTIQAAIDATAGQFSVTVQVRPGTYPETVTIKDRDIVTVTGLDGRPTVVPPEGKNGFRIYGRRSNPEYSRIEISGLDIIGGRTAIWAKTVDVRVLDVAITGAKRGVEITASADASVRDVVVDGATEGVGIRVTAQHGPSVTGCVARNGSRAGFIVRGKGRPHNYGPTFVGGNVAEGNAGEGFVVYDQKFGADELRNNRASGNGRTGIRVVRGTGTLTDNVSENNGGYGYWLDDRSSVPVTPQELMDAGNTATGNLGGDYRID